MLIWVPVVALAVTLLAIYGRIAVRLDRSEVAEGRLDRLEARASALEASDVSHDGRIARVETDVRALLEGRLRIPGVAE